MYSIIIVTDLDNTLLNCEGKITDYTLEILHECRMLNIGVIIATARSLKRVTDLLQDFIPDMMILNGGALALRNDKIMYKKVISKRVISPLLKYLTGNSAVCRFTMVTDQNVFCNFHDFVSWDGYEHGVYTEFQNIDVIEAYKLNVEVSEKYKKEICTYICEVIFCGI